MQTPAGRVLRLLVLMFALAGLMNSLVFQELIHAALSNAKPPRDPPSGLSASTISSIDNRLSPDAARMQAGEALGKLPLSFESNHSRADQNSNQRRIRFDRAEIAAETGDDRR